MKIKITADSTCDLSEELFEEVGHRPDAHAHPDGRGQLSGRCDRPPGGCVRLCEQWRQDAQIRRRQSGGIYGILCPVCQRVRCCDPYFGQQQAVVLLPECTAGCRRIRECLRRGQPEHLHRAGLSGTEGSKVGRRRTDGPRHPDEAAEPCQAGGAELRAGPVGLHGEKAAAVPACWPSGPICWASNRHWK